MTLERILNFDVNRILQFDVTRILRWDIGAALSRPVTHPLLKFAGGWLLGIMVFGMGSVAIGTPLSDNAVRLLGVAVGILFAITLNRTRVRT